MAFPPRFLDELRERVSLAEIVGRRVKLIRRGREYVGLCPFHNEKTPSFNVVEDKGFFHCFGCGAHGDAIGFLMQTESVSFREAVEDLARRAGLEVPVETPEERQRQQQAATLYDVCEAACVFFQQQLKTSAGKSGLDYLRRRGLEENAIAKYRLGWAPDARDVLRRTLAPLFSEELLIAAGLLRRTERGDTFDFFRGRVVFPIANRSGKIIAFGARTLGDDQPKYLNSPDTPIFDKGQTLYGHHWAREASKSEWPPVVVEGYMDAISMQVAGFDRAIAPLGTALTEYQLLELWKLAPDPVICFDGDAAGQRAANRALDRALPLLKPDVTLRFVILPEKEDPDSYVKSKGVGALRGDIRSASPISEFLWLQATEGKSPSFFNTPEKIIKLEARIKGRIEKIADQTVKRNYQHFLYDKIWDLRDRRRQARSRKKTGEKLSETVLLKGASLSEVGEESQRQNIQLMLIAMAVYRPEVALAKVESLSSFEFVDRSLYDIWQVVLDEIWGKATADTEVLMTAVYERMGVASLERVLRSDFITPLRQALHGDDLEFTRAVWDAVVARSRLPGLKVDLEEAVQRWMLTDAPDDKERVAIFQRIVADLETEEQHVQSVWYARAEGTEAQVPH
jgi:DNA primase